jgi:hypothetical protein
VETKQTLRVRQDEDFHAWCLDQAQILRQIAPKVPSLDCLEIAEKLEGMARSEQSAVQSHLQVLLIHLLKWRYEPNRRSHSWRASIQNARAEIRDLLIDSPSLRSKLLLILVRAFDRARRSAGAEMELDEREWEKILHPPVLGTSISQSAISGLSQTVARNPDSRRANCCEEDRNSDCGRENEQIGKCRTLLRAAKAKRYEVFFTPHPVLPAQPSELHSFAGGQAAVAQPCCLSQPASSAA